MKKQIWLLFFAVFMIYQCTEDNGITGETDSYEDAASGELSADGRGSDSGSDNDNGSGDVDPQAGQITAGEWNDLKNWNFWMDLMQDQEYSSFTEYWGFYPFENYVLSLTDKNGNAVSDASVALKSNDGQTVWKTHTDNFGEAVCWENLYTSESEAAFIEITYGGNSWDISSLPEENRRSLSYQLPVETQDSRNIDIMFIVDATGSMGDEIDYLKAEIKDVLNRVKNDYANLNVRLGAVFYRDEGDQFVTRNFSLSSNLDKIIEQIGEQEASGGGDYPEAVHRGLETGINQQEWNENAIARLAFVLLDAPPHHVNEQIESVQESATMASKKGVKIIPITASGTDLATEMLMRFLAITTNGTYVFITDHSGIGGDHLEPSVGDYQVEYLNNLITRLIKKYSTSN